MVLSHQHQKPHMKIARFEDIIAWQKAKELTVLIYSEFKSSRDFIFKDQIQRASLSIMNNIAEGFGRQGPREFRQFLYIARGSCFEVHSMIHLARDLGSISSESFEQMESLVNESGKIISGLIRSIST